jgi:hypothetical protein
MEIDLTIPFKSKFFVEEREKQKEKDRLKK